MPTTLPPDESSLQQILGKAATAGTTTESGYGGSTGSSGFGTADSPNYAYDPKLIGAGGLATLGSPSAPAIASAWGIPDFTGRGPGVLNSPTGFSGTSVPVDPKARTVIDQGVAMLDLYNKLGDIASGKATGLTPAELRAATSLGGDVARAAQLIGKETKVPAKPGKPGKPGVIVEPTVGAGGGPSFGGEAVQGQVGATKGTPAKTVIPKGLQSALGKASKELDQRVTTTLGFSASALSVEAQGKIPKTFATMMQNAGYSVNSNMTLGEALAVPKSSQPASDVTQPQTIGDLMRSLVNGQMSSADISNLQLALFHGGFYDPSYEDGKSAITKGFLDTGTLAAFRNAALHTAELNSQGKNTTLAAVIQQGDDSTDQSLLNPAAFASPPGTIGPSLATGAQLQGTLENAMENYLGRAPTQQELSGFTSYMDGLEKAGSESAQAQAGGGAIDTSTGVVDLPGVPSATQAAETFTQNQNPNEYHAKGVADAFGMLQHLITSPAAVGTSPNTTA